jgi:hypothetical protein
MQVLLTHEPVVEQVKNGNGHGSILAALSPEEIKVLPKAIIVELSCPAGEGDRRRQMKPVVINMVANGFEPERVYQLVREMYERSFTDKEIWDFVVWASKYKERWTSTEEFRRSGKSSERRTLSTEERLANAERFLNGFRCTEADIVSRSPLPIDGDMARQLLITEYSLADLLNVVTDFKLAADGKPCPYGPGVTRSVYQWRRWIADNGVPVSAAGTKYRINPVRPVNLVPCTKVGVAQQGTDWCGSGYGGSFTDGDAERCIYTMVESDLLPMDIQLSVMAKLPIRISSILDTGNRSYHAKVRLTGGVEEARSLLQQLYVVGFDSENSNPSRLERMPGSMRIIGARNAVGTMQRLLYLNPQPTGTPIGG